MIQKEPKPVYPDANYASEWLQPLRRRAFWVSLALLYVTGLVLAGGAQAFRDSGQHVWFALFAFFLIGGIALLGQWTQAGAAWLLVIATVIASLAAATWGGIPEAIWLLLLPVSVATLAIGVPWGIVTAAICTGVLIATPFTALRVSSEARAVAVLGIWTGVGMMYVAISSLLSPLHWAWANYERNRLDLERARDTQVKLFETAEDLASANLQLSRINRLAQALRQAADDERSAKERFVANVSHELRTPLNMIIGFCEMITGSPEAYGERIPPPLLADLNVVLRNSQHLSSLIDDILDLSQLEAGQMALSKERTPLHEIVRSATVAVRPLFESKGLYLKTEIPVGLPLVLCDRTRIREVVLNLLSNAGRFTEQGGVEVRAHADGGNVVVSVTDTGPGIVEEKKARLFTPFEQLDGSIRRRYGGTGLGLSISKSFVELHEGKMWVESEVGQGTTFSFSLPIDPPAELDSGVLRWFNPYEPYEERARPLRAKLGQVQPRLVVVESGETMQRLLHRYLDGTEVVSTTTLEAAFDELASTPTQVLLINDLHITEALQRVRDAQALPNGVPAIVCALPGTGQASDTLGVFDYLVKPISRSSLLNALNRLPIPPKKILLVDDEPDALQLFGRMLSDASHGYQVIRASNGAQALDLLRQEKPDTLLLDLMMPEVDGFQLLAIKNKDSDLRDIPVILISARDPLGQPILSNSLAVTCRRGMSAREVIACVDALTRILSYASPPADRALTGESPD